jgi:GDPmannose 4,6-dehydratase
MQKRDWGFARDYLKAMHAMLNVENAEDYVVSSGVHHSVKEFLEMSFNNLGLNYKDYLVIDPIFYHPTEVELLLGDRSKASQ